jgi:predicted RNA-binding Zn-ribbon protein involved in translation (DUF1610 family)
MATMVCVPCGLFLKIKKNGVPFEELMPNGGEQWVPYKLWMADLYECRGCGAQVIAGQGAGPLAEHYQPTYAAEVARFPPLVRVADCGTR